MKKVFLLFMVILTMIKVNAQVGVGTITPNAQAELHIDVGASTTRGFLVTGSAITGALPDLGVGPKLMFFPGKAAFREGYTNGTQWYNANTGYYSVAMGANTTASQDYAVAMGNSTTASAQSSTAFGAGTTASGQYSTALGLTSTASGLYTLAVGNTCSASGNSAVAMGSGAIASGDFSLAIGHSLNTNLKTGAFFFGDSDPFNKGVRVSGSNDQMACRFNGGYYFISNNNGPDIGVQVPAGGNSWSVASDSRLKEKFLPVDGEDCLNKISKLSLTTWNYKGQDVKHFRHYGPMAQDFYASFGKDELGTIGCDTLINQQDLIGVNLIAIQALEKRTEKLKEENSSLKNEVAGLKSEMAGMKEMLEKMKH